MSQSPQRVVHYLATAHASELALAEVLESQLASKPQSSHTEVLEQQLRETLVHAERVRTRQMQLGEVTRADGLTTRVTRRVRARTRPLGLVAAGRPRGAAIEQRRLEGATEVCAATALKLATYTALEQIARRAGDEDTAALAALMVRATDDLLRASLAEIPGLADALTGATPAGEGAATAGARAAAEPAPASRAPRQGFGRFDALSTDQVLQHIGSLSPADRAMLAAYERRNQNRAAVLAGIDALRDDES